MLWHSAIPALCSNVTVSVKKFTCASVRLEWSLDQLERYINIVIIIIIVMKTSHSRRKKTKAGTLFTMTCLIKAENSQGAEVAANVQKKISKHAKG